MRTGPKKTALSERFWAKVKKTDGCWLWTASVDKKGYGQIIDCVRPVQVRYAAHRLSWLLHKVAIPKGMFVLHKCDVPRCVNPAHLYLGDHRQNCRDMVERGRSTRGERNPQAKLNPAQVLKIRSLRNAGWTYQELADRFHMSMSPIRDICKRYGWRHI